MSAPWESRKTDQRTARDADQTEFLAIRSGSSPLDEGSRDDRIADAMDDFGALDEASNARFIVEDSRIEDAGNQISDELDRRVRLMGDAYPFRIDSGALKYAGSKTLAYELCLSVSLAPTLSKEPYNVLPVSFERLARDAAKCFLGPGAEAFRTGWPRSGEPSVESRFSTVAAHMNRLTQEWIWGPHNDLPDDPEHTDLKDCGIDFAAWKKLPDHRRGILFALGQCACGDDWDSKFSDLDPNLIEKKWFDRFCFASPMRMFALPHHIANERYFEDVNLSAGLTLDRARIAMIAEDPLNERYVAANSGKDFRAHIAMVVEGFEPVARGGSRERRRPLSRTPRRRSRAKR